MKNLIALILGLAVIFASCTNTLKGEISMNKTKFVEISEKSKLPFVYCGERLSDEKCQKAIKKIAPEGTLLGAILGNELSNEGLVITEKGIYFAFASGSFSSGLDAIGGLFLDKRRGVFLFDKFLLHNITAKKTFLGDFKVQLILWNIEKHKSAEYEFSLIVDASKCIDSTSDDLVDVLMPLTSKTGTEYVAKETSEVSENYDETSVSGADNDPNTFEFLWNRQFNNFHTTVTLKDDCLTIHKTKFDNKTKIQIPIGNDITITLSSIASAKKGRGFSPLIVLAGFVFGLIFGFLVIGGFISVILFTILSLVFALPKTLTIKRKDGTKAIIPLDNSEDNNKAYERLIKVIFA
jgi:hypothetical protein